MNEKDSEEAAPREALIAAAIKAVEALTAAEQELLYERLAQHCQPFCIGNPENK